MVHLCHIIAWYQQYQPNNLYLLVGMTETEDINVCILNVLSDLGSNTFHTTDVIEFYSQILQFVDGQ